MHQPSKDSYSQEIYSTTFHPAVSKLTDHVLCLVAQSCLILCNPMDCSPPGFSVHGILQARILEWVPFPFSRDLPKPGIELGSSAGRQILYQLSHLPFS